MKLIPFAALGLVFGSLASQAASPGAGNLAGVYNLPENCAFHDVFFGDVRIPAGTVVIAENVEVSDTGIGETPALLIEAGQDLHAALTLRVGEGAPFSYGASSSSVGTYDQEGDRFTVQSSVPLENQSRVASTIQLTKEDATLRLVYTSSKGQNFCELTKKY